MRKRMRSMLIRAARAAGAPGLAAAMLLGAGGCDAIMLKGSDAEQPAARGSTWPFRPTAMRIHPFTAIQRSTGGEGEGQKRVLEARVELRDQLGDTTKGVGDFRFELYAREPEASQQGERRRIEMWNAPLRTLQQNRRHYDPITHSYLFRLELPRRPPTDKRLRLLVQFNPRRGDRLRAERTVEFEQEEGGEEAAEVPDMKKKEVPADSEGSGEG